MGQQVIVTRKYIWCNLTFANQKKIIYKIHILVCILKFWVYANQLNKTDLGK